MSVTIQQANTGGGGSSPLTTKGDVYTYDTGDARLPVGSDGQVLKANSATSTGLEWDNYTGGNYMVWAEENGAFSTATNSGRQFSYGNGATSTNGIVIPEATTVTALSLLSATATTATVSLEKNGVATGATISLSSSTSNTVTGLSIAVASGDNINFRTTSGSGGSQIVVGAALACEGAQGATGATGAAGADGEGVPVGGATGQVLEKVSGTDYDTQWTTLTASDVSDFDTEVANNSAVTANTAKVSNATHTGDVTGSTVLTLANTAVTAGSYTTADITVDAKGRITAASNGSAGGVTLGTPQATTSGTAFSFGSIPSGTKQIKVILQDVSLSGTDNLLIQIGDSGGLETTGYVSTSEQANQSVNSTSGFIIRGTVAGVTNSQVMTLNLIDESTHTWIEEHTGIMIYSGVNYATHGGGIKSLSAELTQVTVTRTGTDTFDAGKINIQYL